MMKKASIQPFSFTFFFIFLFFLVSLFLSLAAAEGLLKNEEEQGASGAAGSVIQRDQRRSLVESEYGEVSSVDVSDGHRKPYHIQFITLEPNSLFLPVLLHADMVFYVQTGSGRLSWVDENDNKRVSIKRGDLYRLNPGSVFYVQSDLHTERQKLRIHAIFATNTDDDLYDPSIGAYSSIRDLVRGFDAKVLRSAFKVSEEVIEAITNGTDQSAIVHAVPTKQETFWDMEARFLKAFLGGKGGMIPNSKKKKKPTTYNIFNEEPDFENCNGWSLTVDKKNSKLLKGSNIGLFMVNLTRGSMMGPHWNPRATEISIVLHGQGMVRVVCSSTAAKNSECKNMRFRVNEGDVFAVPRFHPMAQMSFNNDSLVFMGFSTTRKKNYPQFLAGKYSVLRSLDKQVLAASFNVTNSTVDQLLTAQADSVILDCTSCAEGEEKVMKEEIEKEREEEEAKKEEEEEARKREEEEAARKREEEEAARKREEEEARKREEEEAARKREEEEAARKREEDEEAARKREEEEAARKREEEEEAARRREEEEEAARKREEEEAQQEQRRPEEEEERKQEEEKERERQQQEEWERSEEEAQREQEEARKQQEERQRAREEEISGRQPEEQQEGGGRGIGADEGRRYLSMLKV